MKKLGIGMLIISALAFLSAFTIPFIVHSGGKMTGWIAGLLILSEAAFWTGGIILGRETAKKYRRFLNPKNWVNKQKKSSNDGE